MVPGSSAMRKEKGAGIKPVNTRPGIPTPEPKTKDQGQKTKSKFPVFSVTLW